MLLVNPEGHEREVRLIPSDTSQDDDDEFCPQCLGSTVVEVYLDGALVPSRLTLWRYHMGNAWQNLNIYPIPWP